MSPNALPHRAFHRSIGTVGARALRAVIEHPRMMLVGGADVVTFRKSSRHRHEKLILLSRELKLQEKSLLLTPAARRCQSCETNTAHMSYAPAQREATP